MKKNQLVLNTLVFLDSLQKGVAQAEMLEWAAQCGVHKVEIRREFLHGLDDEIPVIRKKAAELDIELFYSVPDRLFENGVLQAQKIESYFAEAQAMHNTHVKLNIGDCPVLTPADVETLDKLCDTYGVALTVENDQTLQNGRMEVLRGFMEQSAALGGKTGMTFDVGNWLWQKESPLTNADILSKYTTYIHLKDAAAANPPRTTLLDDGNIPWRTVLQHLPSFVPVALEYPCDTDGRDGMRQIACELKKLPLQG